MAIGYPTHSRQQPFPTTRSRAKSSSGGRARGAAAAKTAAVPRTLSRKAFTGALSQRILIVFALVGFAYAMLMVRLFFLQVVRHEQYVKIADAYRGTNAQRSIPAQRGVIVDRNGGLIVANERSAEIGLDPNLWYVSLAKGKKDSTVPETPEGRRQVAIDGLKRFWPDLDVAKILDRTSRRSAKGNYLTAIIRRDVDWDLSQKVEAAALPGVFITEVPRRRSVDGLLAPQIVGFTSRENIGLEGIERGMDAQLAGRNGKMIAEFDRLRRPIPNTVLLDEPPVPGADLQLTIDTRMQHVAQEALGKAFDESKAESAVAIVLEPKTGDILAIANYPTYDVNNRRNTDWLQMQNRAVTTSYEPGSTLKPITVAAALETGMANVDSTYYCSGAQRIGNHTIHCHGGERHGSESLTDVLRNSCNVATAAIGKSLTAPTLYDFEKRFGIGERTNSTLPGEIRGTLAPYETWSSIQLANIAFGQGVAVTPLQLAAAYGAIANDGVWMRPRILRATKTGGQVKENPIEPGRRVVRSEVARDVRKMLAAVVEAGTGKKAQLTGYTSGGKTGTAQIAANGHYVPGAYVGSFVGMAPAENPEVVVLVAITRPKGGYYGGDVAAPVFKKIAEQALLIRRTPQDKPMSDKAKRRIQTASVGGD